MRLGIDRTIGLLATLLLFAPATASAQLPTGMTTFRFTNTVWDIGAISECQSLAQIGYTVDLCLDLIMSPDGKGNYAGIGILDFSGDIVGVLIGPASGQYKGKETSASAKFATEAQGQLDVVGYGMLPSQIGFSCSGPVDETGYLTSKCSVKVELEGAGSASSKASFDTQLTGAPWSITFNFVPVYQKVFSGSATDSFGFKYSVSGKYNEKKETSTVSAKGLPGDKKNPDVSKGATVKLKNMTVELKNMTKTFEAETKTKVAGASGAEVVQGTP